MFVFSFGGKILTNCNIIARKFDDEERILLISLFKMVNVTCLLKKIVCSTNRKMILLEKEHMFDEQIGVSGKMKNEKRKNEKRLSVR